MNKEFIITVKKQSETRISISENESLDFVGDSPVYIGGLGLTVHAINFQHTPSDPSCSATYLRDSDGVISGDEYTSDSSGIKPALFIFDKLQEIKMLVRFFINDNIDGNASYNMKVRIQHPFLISSVTQAIVISGNAGEVCTCEIIIPRSAIKFSKRSLSAYSGNFLIELSSGDIDYVTLLNKSAKLYFLATRPTGDISILQEHPEQYPIVELIDLIVGEAGFIGDYTQISPKLYENEILCFDFNSTLYSVRQTEVVGDLRISHINVDMKKLLNDIKIKKNIAVASDIYAIVLLYGFWLCGQTANIAFVRAVYVGFDINNPSNSIIMEKHLEHAGSSHYPVGDNASVRYHATVIDGTRVYDASVRMRKSIFNPNMPQPDNVPWQEYLMVFMNASANVAVCDGVIQDGYCHTLNANSAFLVVQQQQVVLG